MTLACLWKGKLSITMMEFSGRLASSRASAASSEKCAYAKALPLFSKTLKCSIVESVKPAMTGIFLHLRHGPTIWHFSPFFDRPLDVRAEYWNPTTSVKAMLRPAFFISKNHNAKSLLCSQILGVSAAAAIRLILLIE